MTSQNFQAATQGDSRIALVNFTDETTRKDFGLNAKRAVILPSSDHSGNDDPYKNFRAFTYTHALLIESSNTNPENIIKMLNQGGLATETLEYITQPKKNVVLNSFPNDVVGCENEPVHYLPQPDDVQHHNPDEIKRREREWHGKKYHNLSV